MSRRPTFKYRNLPKVQPKPKPLPKAGDVEQVITDFDKGQELGEKILGDDGLGRLRETAQMQDVEQRLLEQAEGFSGAETTARREAALSKVQQSGQARERALQAALARSGVKGGAAAESLLANAAQGIQQRANIERDLFIAGEDARRQGTRDLAQFQDQTTRFDLGQLAAEKNIMAQAGLSAAQIASGERTARVQSAASIRAAEARARAACFLPGTLIEMQDGSKKPVETLKVGDLTYLGGAISQIEGVPSTEDIWEYNGAYATASHELFENGSMVKLSESEKGKMVYTGKEHTVYRLNTENGIYVANNFISQNSDVTVPVADIDLAYHLLQVADKIVKETKVNITYEELMEKIRILLLNGFLSIEHDGRYRI